MSEIDYQKLLKDALVEMRKMRSQLDRFEQEKHEPIAVIGMGCRFPGGANNPDAYWEMLLRSVDGITEVPKTRWDIDDYYDRDRDAPGKMYTRYGGFIEDVDKFDPQFFNISPREAEAIDPQQRLLLEVTHNALENAGQSTAKLRGSKTGVFVGQCFDDYSRRSINSGDPTRIDAFNSLGNTSSITAGRIAYVFGLQGATLQLDTTCSSSLVAVHLACQSLRNKESNLAIAGGVNLMLSPEVTIGFCRLKALSADGHCKTFDASADGYVRGEGCGVVILKRLSDAIADSDNILAVIKGSAVNHDGQSNGITAPNGNAQEAVVREALFNAKVKPEEVSYIEAHGTGTSLGDPIEVLALGKVFSGKREHKLKIGSVKSNFGHLESAAGVAGLIKVILSIKNNAIPPHLNYNQPNPYIPWDKLNIEVSDRLCEWNHNRIAGVSSFGMSGTNAHIVVGDAGEQGSKREGEKKLHLLTLSAKSPKALEDLVESYQKYLSSLISSVQLENICYTSSVGRSHYKHRLAITAQSIDELQQKLAGANGYSPKNDRNKIAFLFTGQGSQYVGMGQKLYETEPVFKENCDRCFQILQTHLDIPLSEIIYLETYHGTSLRKINQTKYTQPALFTIEYALAQLWMSWGIQPSAVMGHSIGEYVAATIAGVFSLEDALKLVAARARLMQQLPQNGSMVSILRDLESVNRLIEPLQDKLSIAAINGDKSIVISGEDEAISSIVEELESDGIKYRQLSVSHAFHSPLMQPMLEEFGLVAEEINYYLPRLDIVSNVTGNIITSDIATARYWCEHIINPVLFKNSIETLNSAGYRVFLECGSKPVLLGMARFCLEEIAQRRKGAKEERENYLWASSLKEGESNWQTMLNSVASLYSCGVGIDWDSFYGNGDYRRVVLPTYPFQKRSYWLDVEPVYNSRVNKNNVNSLLGYKLNIARSNNVVFENKINLNDSEFLKGHRVFDRAIMPAAGYMEMALSAGKKVFSSSCLTVENVNIQQPLVITNFDTIQLILTPDRDNYGFEVVSLSNDRHWITHATGNIKKAELIAGNNTLSNFKQRCQQELDCDRYYQKLAQQGLDYGLTFQAIEQLWTGKNTALAKIKLPSELLPFSDNYQLHPVILDACLQTIGAAFPSSEVDIYLPAGLKQLTFIGEIQDYATNYWGYVELSFINDSYLADVYLLDNDRVIARIEKLLLKKASLQVLENNSNNYNDYLYEIKWHKESIDFNSILVEAETIKERVNKNIRGTTDLLKYKQLVTELEQLSLAYIFQAFNNIDLQLRLGDWFTIEELITKYKIVPAQQKLFTRLLEILAAESILTKSGDTWNVVNPVGKVNLELKLNKLQQYSEIYAELNLLIKCGSQLDRILQGEVEPLNILFPQGDLSSLTNLYQDSHQAQYLNNIVKNAVVEAIRNKPSSRQLKILEIGAGTGSTTAYLLPELQDKNVEYTFSDISPLFITKAKEKFSDYDFVNYQILDIEQEQELAEYDLIIAVNVIHATEKLAVTISNVRQLLADRGLFLLVEGTQPLYWVDLIFGLTEGWWRFKDDEWRESHPLVSARQWESLLQANGFDRSFPLNNYEDSQAVIIGQRKQGEQTNDNWLLFSDNLEISQSLNTLLDKQEQPYNFIYSGDRYQQLTEKEFILNLESERDIEKFFEALKESYSNIGKIIYFCKSDGLNTDINVLAKSAVNPILKLVQYLVKNNINLSQLVLVTQGAVSPSKEERLIQSTVWGIGKAIALEHPELNCTRIDLDPAYSVESQLENLIAEIYNKTTEEIVFRNNNRYLPRLSRYQPPKLLNNSDRGGYLAIDNSGSLDKLYLKPKTRQQPDRDGVEIKVKATGLNFRDVLTALNLYPGNASLGCECTGEVVVVGDNVRDLQIGDRVIAIASNTFSQYVTIERSLVVKFPDYISFTDAATIPVTFLTAYYSLCHLGKIATGKRVLIHSAAGGVGQAAIQLAQKAGAEVFATASIGKWDYLKSLGVKHIMNSRNLDFVEEIDRFTNGEGVDIILNCLSGEFIPASLSVLKADGCFLEIGKLNIWEESVKEFRKGDSFFAPSYHIIDMVELCQQQPNLIQSMLKELMDKFDRRYLQPLPKTVFALPQAKTAFRYLQQAKHIGKVVITPELTLDANGTYLIAGGLGGLGILTAHWLADKGAKNLLLLGRSKPSVYAQQEIEKLEQRGVTVDVIQTDITNYNTLQNIVARTNSRSRIRGIIHAAGILDDSAIQNMTWEQMENVLQPKVAGAWNLHNLTKDTNLDFFILFSSAVSLLGSPGQANHVAANTFLDSLAHYRHSLGLPAMSINWGTWSNIGAAAEKQADTRMSQLGVNAIAPEQGIAILERLFLGFDPPQPMAVATTEGTSATRCLPFCKGGAIKVPLTKGDLGGSKNLVKEHINRHSQAQIGVINVNWDKFLKQGEFSAFFNEFKQSIPQEVIKIDLQAELNKVNPTQRRSLLLLSLRSELARVLGFQVSELNTKTGFFDLGMDSLTAIEFKNRLQDSIGFTLPSTVAFDYPNLEALADYILDKIFPEAESSDEADIADLLAAELAAMEEDK